MVFGEYLDWHIIQFWYTSIIQVGLLKFGWNSAEKNISLNSFTTTIQSNNGKQESMCKMECGVSILESVPWTYLVHINIYWS